jgi:hypothetical protein
MPQPVLSLRRAIQGYASQLRGFRPNARLYLLNVVIAGAAMGVFRFMDSGSSVSEARFYDQAFTIGIGLLWLIFMIVTEAYFREGAKRADLPRRVGRVIGPELLLIFLADLTLFWVQQGNVAGWLRWVILSSELALGFYSLLSDGCTHPARTIERQHNPV